MMMKVFFKVPNKLGYFDDGTDTEITPSVNNEDDAYKAAVWKTWQLKSLSLN